MRGLLSEAVDSVAEGYLVLGDDDPLSFFKYGLHWIAHFIHLVFDSILHFATDAYDGLESQVQRLVDACNENSTFSSVVRGTKNLTGDGGDSLADVLIAAVILGAAAVVVLVVLRCLEAIPGVPDAIIWCQEKCTNFFDFETGGMGKHMCALFLLVVAAVLVWGLQEYLDKGETATVA